MAKRKKYRRMTHYPGNLNVAVTDGTKNGFYPGFSTPKRKYGST